MSTTTFRTEIEVLCQIRDRYPAEQAFWQQAIDNRLDLELKYNPPSLFQVAHSITSLMTECDLLAMTNGDD